MPQPLIVHIPHSSHSIPLMEGYVMGEAELSRERAKLTDWHTDELYHSSSDTMVQANFSRIFCDVERFADDEQEVMAQYGMGVLYEKCDDGKALRKVTAELREHIITKYYQPHHAQLSAAVAQHLSQYGRALILDGHSFPNTPFIRDLDQSPNRPDFNIGTDSFHTPAFLLARAQPFFEERGFSVGVNKPYSGTIVPLENYKKDANVWSIMLEINRKLYMHEATHQKNANFATIQHLVKEFMKVLRNSF